MAVLHLKDISVKTKDGAEVVKGVSLRVKPGEVYVVMGQNGSGKSSLVNAIMGHPRYCITKGSVLLGREDITKLPPEEKARHGLFLSMQYVPEIEGITLSYFLYQVHKGLTGETMSVMDFYTKAVDEARAVGISESLLKRPIHAGLSGGERKQAEILQLLMLRPKFAFLDEIDSGVDIGAMKKVFQGLKKLQKEGTAIVLITHYPDVLKRITPDTVQVMKNGKIAEKGGKELVQKIAKEGF